MDEEKTQLIRAAEKYRYLACKLLKEIYNAGFDKWSECQSWGLADDAGHELDDLMYTNKSINVIDNHEVRFNESCVLEEISIMEEK